ncbi:multidrug ABC transporter ATPase [Cryobacterium tagatosivorans]|uniref:Multidrug ABC transporter ATPase n=1 Tax=Cryobacterium tagatosivorans TaxID=1259199 RepID=A0A4R8UC53_9MICO|nr:multidrug ABC transporter ATPase [Cryobacterium tagatosivorans]TFB48904.1 multidrug ABC transporter ATPase [Cryobacterium tagatosivorans]
MTNQTARSSSRIERILAFMVAGVVGLSILAFLAIIIGTVAGAGANDGFSSGIWPVVFTLPYYGLPVGFLAIVTLMVMTGVRRSREARQNRR